MTDILFATPDNPLPEVHRAGFFESHDGLQLRYAIFKGHSRVPRGTVVLAQGRNETIEKYAETITDLAKAGLWVATFDWRGQGGSPRILKNKRFGHVERFRDYEKDLDTFFEKIVLPDAKLPFFIVAHSMGALIAFSNARNLANRIERMVLSAPFLGLATSKASPGVVRFVARIACLFGLGKMAATRDREHKSFEGNVLTSDPARFARNRQIVDTHPELAIGRPTWRWLLECLKAQQRVMSPQYLASITVPTLILGATNDKVASYPAIETVSRYFRAGKLIPIDGAEHELFQERDRYRAQALAAILAFIPGSQAEPMQLEEEAENAAQPGPA